MARYDHQLETVFTVLPVVSTMLQTRLEGFEAVVPAIINVPFR